LLTTIHGQSIESMRVLTEKYWAASPTEDHGKATGEPVTTANEPT
jgi:hypothetical protein